LFSRYYFLDLLFVILVLFIFLNHFIHFNSFLSILIMSDNGGAPAVGGYNYPYRGQKATGFEGGIRVPALIQAPDYLRLRNGTYDNLIHVSDLAPSILGIIDRFNGKQPSHDILGDIDGIDQSGVLMASTDLSITPAPRTSLLAEYHLVFNMTAYIDGDWKLILGTPGLGHRFWEPVDAWYDADKRPFFMVEEVVCDAIDHGLGTHWFAVTWAYRFMANFFYDYYSFFTRSERVGFSDWDKYIYLISHPYNSTIPVTDTNLPRADWNRYDRGYVRLYNLKTDPYEDHNVALENRELVESLVQKIHHLLRSTNPPGHHMSMQKQMTHFMQTLAAMWVGFWVLVIILVLLFGSFQKTGKKVKKE